MDLSSLTPEQRKELEEKLKNMSPEEIAKLQAQQCIFCQIISGKIPSKKVYEDEHCFAVLDINPSTKGHLLLLPKQHAAIMPQLSDAVLGHLFSVSKRLSQVLLKSMRASGTTIFAANGAAAGQRAQHFMLHIIPRKDGDSLMSYSSKLVDLEKRKVLGEIISTRVKQLQGSYEADELEDKAEESVEKVVPVQEKKAPEQKKSLEEEFMEKEDSNEESKKEEQKEDDGEVSLDDIANLFK